MGKWYLGGITVCLILGASWPSFAREIAADGSVEEATGVQVASRVSAERTWKDLKSKAQNLWTSYFGDQERTPRETVKKQTKTEDSNPNNSLADSSSQSSNALPPNSQASSTQSIRAEDPSSQAPNVSPTPVSQPSSNIGAVTEVPNDLPKYQVQNKGVSREEIQSVKQKIQENNSITMTSPGRQGTSQLPIKAGGAPQYDFYESKKIAGKKTSLKDLKIKKKAIPLLDIGEEPSISAQSMIDLAFSVFHPKYSQPKPLKQPDGYSRSEAEKWIKKKPMMLGPFDYKAIRKGLVDGYPVTREMVDKIILTELEDAKIVELSVRPLSKDEQAMLTALVMNRKGDKCPLVIGLLDDLSKKKPFVDEASFELGICAQKLKLYSQAFSRLIKVIEAEDSVMAPQAISILAADLPAEYEVKMTKILDGLKNKALIPELSRDDVNYVIGKGYFKQKKYDLAISSAQKVSEKNKRYIQARYLLGVSEYAADKGQAGMKTLLSLREWMEKRAKSDKNVSSLMAINMARIYFNLGNYKSSLEEYKKIGKDHPVWLQGLIEQGWAQVLVGDNSGAIGNMHSLHSPYFKAVYKPESYVVRSIGYLNICQYGDAYKSLHRMEQEHLPWAKAMEDYLARKKTPGDYYDTIKNYLRSSSSSNIDGLPSQIVREMGRSRDFLNYQTGINEKVDEGDRYPGVPAQLALGVKDIQTRMNRAKTRYAATILNLEKAKKDPALAKNVNEWTAQKYNDYDLLVGYKFQLNMLDESKRKLSNFQMKSISQLNDEKGQLREAAGVAVGKRIVEMKSEVKRYLENNELLRYEIFAGAGENIRYQVAGGETAPANRIPANVKPTKILNWEFDGEYWEDEIGNYRSQAQDNCPQKGKIGAGGSSGVQTFNAESK
jgi:tetratricopeptide (TPR) repeat protein